MSHKKVFWFAGILPATVISLAALGFVLKFLDNINTWIEKDFDTETEKYYRH